MNTNLPSPNISNVNNTSGRNESDTEEEKIENTNTGSSENGEDRNSSPNSQQISFNGDLLTKTGFLLFKKGDSIIRSVFFYPYIFPTSTFLELKKMASTEFDIPISNLLLKLGEQELNEVDTKPLSEIFDFTSEFCVWVQFRNNGSSDEIQESQLSSASKNSERKEEIDEDFRFIARRNYPSLCGLKNQGATCYLNSLIQVLFLTPEFRKTIFEFPRPYEALLGPNVNIDPSSTERPDKDIIFQMQMLFAKMQYSQLMSVSTTGLTTSFGWDNSDIFVQHDVQELNRVLCDKLEEKMKGTAYANSIAALYKGVMLNLISCKKCNGVSSREEDYYDISLVIKGKKNIIESLNDFTTVEILQDDNAYFCERCQSKQTAEKCIKFKSYPKILNLQLKRFEYDWNKDIRIKLHDEIDFPLFLEMDPFMVLQETLQKTLKNDENYAMEKNNIYELFGICVHSGNAGFGHYYAFIKNFTDGKWYKFNDETITQIDENDIKNQNWFGEVRTQYSSWQGSSVYQRSATPYMLVYRKNEAKKTSILPPIPNEEIPEPIRQYIEEQTKKREESFQQQQKESDNCVVYVLRNRLHYPTKVVKISRQATLEDLRKQVIELVKDESKFRRIANRKNATKRPMNLFPPSDYSKSLKDLMLDKKQHIYLEQEKEEVLPSLDEFSEDKLFFTVRRWDKDLRRPISVRDFVFPNSKTLGELKEFLSPYIGQDPSEMVIYEEETEELINPMLDDSQTLTKYRLMSGDILHVEPINKEVPNKKTLLSFTKFYYQNKKNELCLEIEEGPNTFKKRISNQSENSSEVTPIQNGDSISSSEKDNNSPVSSQTSQKKLQETKISFKLYCSKTNEFQQLKNILSFIFGVEPRRLRVYVRDITGYSEGRLLKDLQSSLENILTKYKRTYTSLYVEIIDHPEDLKRGDKLFKIKYYNIHHEFTSTLEIKINKVETIRDMKLKLKEKTEVHEDHQIISEWHTEHFFKLFLKNDLKISDSHIRKSDIIRMDALKDSALNLSNKLNANPNIALQLVQFKTYETTHYGKKEMQTTFPSLFIINENYTIFDLRKKLAEEIGIPFYNFNFAKCSSFPIYQESIEGIRGLTERLYNFVNPKNEFTPEEEEEIEKINQLAKQENKEGKSFEFKKEKQISVKKLGFANLQVLIWEDIRKTSEEPNQSESQKSKNINKSKKRDTETLKIKN